MPYLRYIALLLILSATAVFADSYTPGIYNLTVSQGEDYRRLLIIQDATKHPVNLAGYSFRGAIRLQPAVTVSTQIDPATGRLWLIIPRTTTATIGGKAGPWDLQMTFPDGSVTYLLKGQFSCAPTVTR